MVNNWFTYHSPDPNQTESYKAIRDAGRKFAEVVLANTPESADQTTAIRTIREAVMWANASIACGGK